MVLPLDNRQEMVAGELADLARETDRAVGNQDLGLADTAGVEKELTRGGIARRVLVAKAEIEPIEWDPAGLAAPPGVD